MNTLKQSKRGGQKLVSQHTYMIEGETVTARQICERLGLAYSTVHRRITRERAKPGAVTWAGLKTP